jgi:hypothetical protein
MVRMAQLRVPMATWQGVSCVMAYSTGTWSVEKWGNVDSVQSKGLECYSPCFADVIREGTRSLQARHKTRGVGGCQGAPRLPTEIRARRKRACVWRTRESARSD